MTFTPSTLPHEAQLSAGSATEDITPTEAVPMSGYGAREGLFESVHDPLMATSVVLSDGATTVAIVSADLLNVSRELTTAVRSQLTNEGVELDELLLAASHTHAGPYIPARALDATRSLRVETDVSESLTTITQQFVNVIVRAHSRLEPAQIRVGQASEREVPNNRRASGGVSGNVRVPYGPVDSDVTVVLVETATGEETVIYNFACHPVCTTPDEYALSADWPGYTRQRIESERDGMRVLFLNGAAGDINPAGSMERRTGKEVYEYMEQVGTRVGETVLEAIADAEASEAISTAPIYTDDLNVRFPVKTTPPRERLEARLEALDSQLRQLERDGDETGRTKLGWDRRYVTDLLAIADWDARCLPNRLPYIEVGDSGLLGMPGEVLTQHGLDFKSRARVDTLLPAGYVNDYVGYIPTLADLENVGYEVRTMKIAPEAIGEFREASLDLIQ
ncbi:neutral/alkaline non-lysosomal ceramidase N-terminal domain-containing protein [Haloprofundus salinisoli]|uniref:neutral/alkaline non-lysosomal ceramidase N-terminal domain-containing protein n=1 Tax=Haloprofundus salinisoli TaxID=2876193 RepID=UPI001CCDF6BF|nr:neutral/alkaline non-lysosomal ceramidase N-terminal domain-containing protein [Haloprofundus salinisoli]